MAVRPVDAEKYMELLKEQYLHHEAMGNKQVAKAWQGAMQLLYDMPTLTPPNEWVSVEERLPTDEHPVLVFLGYADTMTGFITTSSYFCFDENPHWQWDGLVRDEQRTLFWMPLPAPPGKDNNVPTNEPLTIEELREMDGEPVYVHNLFPAKRKFEWQWALVCKERGNAEATTYTYRFLDYGKTWIAYRRPPEGEEDT